MSEKEYRQMLSKLRSKITIVEKNLTTKDYDKIDFEAVPTKAMLKYTNAFKNHIALRFSEYKMSLAKGDSKVNTKGLFCHEVIKKVLDHNTDNDILDSMWNNQKGIDFGDSNILVVADTSGSMQMYNSLPYAASIGLALYTAERNKGIFKNRFITFSSEPTLQEVKGSGIAKKVRNIKMINSSTNIDKVFKML